MRGATSHDGKMSGNVQMISRYDQHKKQRPHEGGGHSGGEHEESGHDEMKHIVAEHGIAHKHIVTKNEHGGAMGGFHSETHHESGHVAHADHDSLDEAHEHGQQAMEDTEHNTLDREGQELAEERDESESGGHNKPQSMSFLD